MVDSSRPPSKLLHASIDLTIAALAGALAIGVFFPLTLCVLAVKSVLALIGLRRSRSRENTKRWVHAPVRVFANQLSVTQYMAPRQPVKRQRQPVA